MAKHASIEGLESLEIKLDSMSKGDPVVPVVKVGIVKSATYPIETMEGRPKRKKSVEAAQVLLWNEFGTKGGGWGGPIPPRPLMRQSVEAFKKDERLIPNLQKHFDIDEEKFRKDGGKMMGTLMWSTIIRMFREGKFVRNSPVTIAFKTKGKGNKTKPLIDTRHLSRSMAFEVYKKGTRAKDADRGR